MPYADICTVHTTMKLAPRDYYTPAVNLWQGETVMCAMYSRVVLGLLLRPHGTIFVFLTASPSVSPANGRGDGNIPPAPALKIAVRKQPQEEGKDTRHNMKLNMGNIMRNSNTLRRLMAATLAIVMAMSLTVSAFAAEIETDTGPDLEAIAALYVNWDGSYELPDLSELSPEDQEAVKAMVDAAMLAKEAEAQAQAEAQAETQVQAEINDEVPATVSFSDVPTSHTFYKGIIYCASKGIVNGYPDGTFRPATTVAKNHFCAMLARAFYANTVDKYSTDYIKNTYGTFGPTNRALSAEKILTNTSFEWQYDNSSVMTGGINRYDMAQLMTNIMKAKGATASTSQKNAAQSKIADYKNIPSKYQDAVKNVYALGVIGGYGDGSFKGTNIMNRGQAAIVIQRMAQYAPVRGDQDNDVYDDGTEQKPNTGSNTGTSSGNTGSTSSGNTGSSSTGNTGSSSSSTGSSTGTTTKPETKPETPAAKTLRDGSAVTEANALKIIQEILKVYPNGTAWGSGKAGWRDANVLINNRRLGSISSAIMKIENTYHSSVQSGCGGFAGVVSDAIFGGRDNGGENFPIRKLSSVAQVRPGDIIAKLNANGEIKHILTAATSVKSTTTANGVTRYCIGVYDGNNNSKVNYSNMDGMNYITDDLYRGSYYEAWTRYPD